MSDQRQQQERCQSGEALAEWRLSDQVENGTPSTSPSYRDSDGGYEGGLKPPDLYGKYTWKIEKFSKINKRELRSDAFEIGGYKWYILIYPHGCDVSNHLSLFLCVADHDKLLPGWSHFAQLTIAVVNKDPRKSKYSDTLHRFWKKEHDWGWKKFMELPKLLNEFIEADTLIIEAQVQVIRERAERPLRYLDCRYRRELVRVYLTNVEQICRRFLEERRGKFGKLIGDKSRWPSFCTFWLGMDQTCKRRMSREKTETILKVVVKNFFIEKEVTSTLVMDSLYTGLRALELQYKGGMSKFNYMEVDKLPMPIVRVEKEMFVLVDDVLPLLERAAMEPLPSKGEKGTQNRIPDETLGKEFHKDFVECERRLTVLGRRTIEIFVLAHVFNKIEVAYQEAVSLKKQEELIREEEAAWLADIELRAKRGAVDKEKKSKKKQAKQNRNNRKSKDKGKDDKPYSIAPDRIEPDIHIVKKKDSLPIEPRVLLEKSDDVAYVSDTSDSVVCVREILPEEREASPASSTGVSGFSSVQTGTECRSSSVVDDSSSTCSSDSVHSISITVPHTGSYHYQKNERSHSRGRNHLSKLTSHRAGWIKEEAIQPSKDVGGTVNGSQSPKAVEPPSHHSFDRQIAEDEDVSRKCGAKSVDVEASLLRCPLKSIPSLAPWKSDLKVNAAGEKTSSDRINGMHEANLANNAASVTEMGKFAAPKFSEKPTNVELQKIENPSKQPVMFRTDKPLNAPPTQRHPPPPQSYLSAIVGGSLPASAYNHFAPSFVSTPSDWIHQNQIKPSISFGTANHPDRLQNAPLWLDSYQRENSGMQSCDEFPHLDIINDLLDDEHVDISDSGNRSFSNGLSRHFSSSRLEGSRSYLDEAFRQSYAIRGASPDALGNISSLPFLNGQIAGLTPYQWQMASAHQRLPDVAPYPNLTVDVNGYVVYRPPNGF